VIVSRCPVRVSLAGGSTDLDQFLQRYGYGSVLSFSANIYCHIALNFDRLGLNGLDEKYVINYMNREVVDKVSEIKNDVARVVLDHYRVNPTTLWFTSDVYSSGSGLASSTAYLIALLTAVHKGMKTNIEKSELCSLALRLERQFNGLTGYQDPYGCGTGGFNRLHFWRGGKVEAESLEVKFLDNFNMYLVSTGTSRSSTDVLKSIDTDKCKPLLEIVDRMHQSILNSDRKTFLELISAGWEEKKKTGKILENENVARLDNSLSNDKDVLAHRLLGAGNGGFFLVFTEKNTKFEDSQMKNGKRAVRVSVCTDGPQAFDMR